MRMLHVFLLSVAIFIAAALSNHYSAGSLMAVSLYKLHLATLAAWMGYWADRFIFPYARPGEEVDCGEYQLRRALIVLGAFVCIGLGA